ncbi:MAG: TRAP transporter substrate-binding protein [Burkholderiaceae bacterium]
MERLRARSVDARTQCVLTQCVLTLAGGIGMMNTFQRRKAMTIRLRDVLRLILGATVVSMSMSAAQAQTTLKLGHVSGDKGPIGSAATRLATALEALSGGELKIQIVARGALGGLNEHWAQLRTGALDMTVVDVPAVALMKEGRSFGALTTPFLFRDQGHLRSFGESDLFASMTAGLEQATGIRFLSHVGERAPRALATTRQPVRSVADLQSLKIRTPPSPMVQKVFQAWGAVPTPTSAAEMLTALKSGAVDGNDLDVLAVAHGRSIKVIKYFTPIDYARASIGAWISSVRWEKLDERQRAWLVAAAQAAGRDGQAGFDQEVNAALAKIRAAGIEVIEPDIASFHPVTRKIVDAFEGKVWPAGTVARIQSMR